ncbi:hypothetical protein HNV12_06475 [Methanococcoides sp. SA1]|nr:hypothetical protein [Methanococcoides sp. SA1]
MSVSEIISQIFGDADCIPVFDRTAYHIPLEFWKQVKVEIDDFEFNDLQSTTFYNLNERTNDRNFHDQFMSAAASYLDLDDFTTSDDILEKCQNLTELNEYLFDYLSEFGMRLDVDIIKQQQQSRFSMKRRDIVREAYRKYEEQQTSDAFQTVDLDYPLLMIDRIVFFVFSSKCMSFNPSVKQTINDNLQQFHFTAETERWMHTKQNLLSTGYTDEEVDIFCPVDLDDEFDLMKHRSLLKNYDLTTKPKLVRDGSGWAYSWTENGMTYRFTHKPPAGRPIGLMVRANMQTMTWHRILQDHPEFEDVYNNEFLKEPNFIPLGYEKYYFQHEQSVFEKACDDILQTYHLMMNRIGFPKVDDIACRVTQAEVCWNLPMPIDLGHHLWKKYDDLRSIGLNPELAADTPLMFTPFYSDVDTGVTRFKHKEYRKSKRVFRNEVIFNSEMKNEATLQPAQNFGKWNIPAKKMPIGEWFFVNLELTKQYFFYKLHRRYEQINGSLEHGYYDWRNASVDVNQNFKCYALSTLLAGTDLPEWLKDVQLFDALVDQDYLTKRFFRNLTDQEYRYRVREEPELFEKTGHGRYRLKHDAVRQYRQVRNALNSPDRDFTFIDSSMEH